RARVAAVVPRAPVVGWVLAVPPQPARSTAQAATIPARRSISASVSFRCEPVRDRAPGGRAGAPRSRRVGPGREAEGRAHEARARAAEVEVPRGRASRRRLRTLGRARPGRAADDRRARSQEALTLSRR